MEFQVIQIGPRNKWKNAENKKSFSIAIFDENGGGHSKTPERAFLIDLQRRVPFLYEWVLAR